MTIFQQRLNERIGTDRKWAPEKKAVKEKYKYVEISQRIMIELQMWNIQIQCVYLLRPLMSVRYSHK